VLRRLLALGVLCAVVFPFLSIVRDAHFGWKDFQEGTKVWVCVVTGVLGMLMLLRAAVRGAGAVAGEKDKDTWGSLLGTPLSTHEILGGKCYGCVLGQRDAMYLLAAVWAVGVLTLSVNLISVALAAGALAVYLVAFAWLGICCSVTARNTRVAIARAVPLAILVGGGFWMVLGCFGACLGAGGGSGTGELLGHAGVFLLGFTPPVVLGGLPALDPKTIEDITRSNRGQSVLGSMACGGVFGIGAWVLLAIRLHEKARELFEREANRGQRERWPDNPDSGDRLGDLPPFRTPSPAPPPADPPGSWGSGGTS
jgi:hypothetical protein